MKFKNLIIFFLIFLVSSTFWGKEVLTLDNCIKIALEKNPLVKSYYYQYQSSVARTRQAKAVPQPEISFDFDLQPKLFNFKKSDESYIGINQLIEFPGRRYLRGKIAKKESEEFLSEYDLIRLDLIFQVKKAFYELLLAFENQKYIIENYNLTRDFLTKAREKYQSGDVAKMEVLRAKVEAAKTENQMKVAANRVKLAKTQLNFVLAREKFKPINVKGTLQKVFFDMDLGDLTKKALLFRPEIKKAKLSLERKQFVKKQAYLSYLPDFSLGISQHRITGEPNYWDVTLSFEVPLFFWQKQRGEIAESKATLEAAKSELRLMELTVSLEVENAFQNANSYKNQIELFEREVLKEAEEVYRMSMISYLEGKIGSIELIESRRTLIELKQSYAETLFNFQLALAELEKFVGTALQGGKK